MSRFTSLLKHAGELAPQTKQMLKGWAEELKVLQANPAGNEAKIQVLSDRIKNTTEASIPREAPMQGPERLRTTNQPQVTKSDSGNILIPGEGKSAADLLQESRQVRAGDVLKEGFQDPLQRDLNRLNAYAESSKKAGGIQINPVKEVNSTESIMKKVAGMGTVPAAGQFENPLDMIKKGYGDFEQGREKVSDSLANQVTGYLPQVSKEKSIGQAKSVMNMATDPLTYTPGLGGVDAVLGAASALPEVDEETKARFKNLFEK